VIIRGEKSKWTVGVQLKTVREKLKQNVRTIKHVSKNSGGPQRTSNGQGESEKARGKSMKVRQK